MVSQGPKANADCIVLLWCKNWNLDPKCPLLTKLLHKVSLFLPCPDYEKQRIIIIIIYFKSNFTNKKEWHKQWFILWFIFMFFSLETSSRPYGGPASAHRPTLCCPALKKTKLLYFCEKIQRTALLTVCNKLNSAAWWNYTVNSPCFLHGKSQRSLLTVPSFFYRVNVALLCNRDFCAEARKPLL